MSNDIAASSTSAALRAIGEVELRFALVFAYYGDVATAFGGPELYAQAQRDIAAMTDEAHPERRGKEGVWIEQSYVPGDEFRFYGINASEELMGSLSRIVEGQYLNVDLYHTILNTVRPHIRVGQRNCVQLDQLARTLERRMGLGAKLSVRCA